MKFTQRLALLASPDLRDIASRVADADRLLRRAVVSTDPAYHDSLVEAARDVLDLVHVKLAGRSIR